LWKEPFSIAALFTFSIIVVAGVGVVSLPKDAAFDAALTILGRM
jgi:hypothetical protein